MSMNLVFRDGRAISEFPYQTSTELSNAVMKAGTNEEKLKLIKADLEQYSNGKIYKDSMYDFWLSEIKLMLECGWQIDII